jgi:glucoamylase
VATLAAASLCYRRAASDPKTRLHFLERGDAFIATVRDLTPESGCLSEQVDRTSGIPTSARDLTWSYAAFAEAAHLRDRVTL